MRVRNTGSSHCGLVQFTWLVQTPMLVSMYPVQFVTPQKDINGDA